MQVIRAKRRKRMKDKIDVSVIVPMYNAEPYVEQCLKSLINQSFSGNYEIIVIDDGSTDMSYEKAKNIAKAHPEIRLLKKKNGGVSSARNYALEKVRGKYVLFVDADDYVDYEFVDIMTKKIEPQTMRICGFIRTYPSKQIKRQYRGKVDASSFPVEGFIDGAIGGYCCNKIYDYRVVKEEQLRFNESLSICEDCDFNLRYAKQIKRVEYIPEAPYYYRQNENSALHSGDKVLAKEIMKTISAMRSSKNLSENEKAAIDYMEIWEKAKFYQSIDPEVLNRFIRDNRVSLSKKTKLMLKITLKPVYLMYRKIKGYR